MIKHIGTTTIETERLILRRFTPDDAEDMFHNWANDEEVTKHLCWLPHKNVEASKEIINLWINAYDKSEVYNWAIVPKDYQRVIGSISVVNQSNEHERCEIGYCIGREYWNKGVMTEALKAIIQYLIVEIGFNRVQAIHYIENPASGKVMVKSGMKYEGRLRNYHINNKGIHVDCDMYAILKEDL